MPNIPLLSPDGHAAIDHTGITGVGGGGSGAFVGAKVYNSGTQNVSNGTITTLTWNSETIDTDAFHDTGTNPERLTVPTGKAGKYRVVAHVGYPADADGDRVAYIYKNGTTTSLAIDSRRAGSAEATRVSAEALVVLAEADYVIARCYHLAGGTLAIESGDATTSLSLEFLGT